MSKRGVKGQVVSIDLILSVVIFISIIVGFFYLVTIFSEGSDTSKIQSEGESIPRGLQSNISSLSFIKGNTIDVAQLYEASGKSYSDLQNSLGISNDFCIYFVDEQGYVIPINGKPGLGSDKVILGDEKIFRCGVDLDAIPTPPPGPSPGPAPPGPPPPDTTDPTVTVTSPTAGTLVSGTVTISATANDNVGITKVEFYVDGIKRGTDYSEPYSFDYDTTLGGTHGCGVTHTHSLTAGAYDAADNQGDSSPVSVNMDPPGYCSGGTQTFTSTAATATTLMTGSYTSVTETYSASEVSTANCASGTCSTSNSWNSGFEDGSSGGVANLIEFTFPAPGVTGSTIDEITFEHRGCHHGELRRTCSENDNLEVESGQGVLQVEIYDGSSWVVMGSAILLGSNSISSADDYHTNQATKTGGYTNNYVQSGNIKVRMVIAGQVQAQGGVQTVTDYAAIHVTT